MKKKKSILDLFDNEIISLITTIAVYEFLKWYAVVFIEKLFN